MNLNQLRRTRDKQLGQLKQIKAAETEVGFVDEEQVYSESQA